MFSNFFKPKWQHSKAQVRCDAITTLSSDNTEQLEILVQLAQRDPDTQVRCSAIEKLSDPALLLSLRNEEQHKDIRHSCQQRIISLLLGQSLPSPTPDEFRHLIQQLDDQHLLYHLLQHSDHEEQQIQVLSEIKEEETLEDAATSHQRTKIRLYAAQRIQDPERLQRIAKHSKNKDKGVYHSVKEKLDRLRATRLKQQQQRQLSDEICANIELLAKMEHSALYEPKYKGLLLQWTNLGTPSSEEHQQRFDLAKQTCTCAIEKHAQQQAELEAQSLAQQQLDACCSALNTQLNHLKQQHEVNENQILQIARLLEQEQQVWQKAKQHTHVDKADGRRFQHASKALERYLVSANYLQTHHNLISQLQQRAQALHIPNDAEHLPELKDQLQQQLDRIQWPTDFPLPPSLKALNSCIAELKQKQYQLKHWQQDHIPDLEPLVSQLETQINEGQLALSDQTLNKIQALIGKLPEKQIALQQKRLNKLKSQVHELKDWRGFASKQQRESLCLQMESLANNETIEASERADLIKQYQEHWKALGPSKPSETKALWQRFKRAGDRAFEPCRNHYKEQGEIRRNNLAARSQLCDQLEQYITATDWDSPHQQNWKKVETIIETAKQEWRNYSPVDRKPGKGIHVRFDAALQHLRGQLKQEHQRNLATKQAIIASVEALLEHEPLNEAIEHIKAYQSQWESIGLTQHRQNQQAWKQFRHNCDLVFQRRDKQRQEQQQKRIDNQALAETICIQLEQLASQDEPQPAQFQQLCRQFYALGALPKTREKAIQHRYDTACAGITARQTTAEQRQKIQHARALIEQAQAGSVPPPYQRIEELCIQLEIMAGIESPVDAKKARLAYQVQCFNKGLTVASADPSVQAQQALELAQQWHQLGCRETTEYLKLRQRFLHTLDQIQP